MNSPNNAGDTDLTPKPSSTGRWLRIALAASLAVNLGIVGVMAGAVFRHGGPQHGATMARDVGFGPFTDALSKEDRAELRRAFLAAAPEMRDSRRAVRADFQDLLAQLRASPFDADALRVVFDRQNARNAERLELGQRLIFDLVVGMKPDARAAFADRLEQSLAKGPKRRDKPPTP
jgi:uncharacterized membrane protein